MPYSVEWLVEQRILVSRYYGEITLEDARGQITQANALLRTGIPLVHSIVDMTGVTNNPSIQMVKELRLIDMSGIRDKMGWTIILTNNTLLKFASSLFVPILQLRQRFFADMDEALAFLQDEDPTLPPLLSAK
ncbi:MAG: hypothetical protein R3E39_23790 [Anaerolineae bacterium]